MRLFCACISLTLLSACGGEPATEGPLPDRDWVVVFSSSRSGNGDLYALDPADGSLRRLTSSDIAEGAPRVDGARERLVHHRYEGTPEVARLFEGGTFLLDDPNGEIPPVWRPDGQGMIYAADRNGQVDLYAADADGANEQPLTQTPEQEKYPALSADGNWLAWLQQTGTGWDVMLASVQTPLRPRRITGIDGYAGHLTFSADGSWLALDMMFDDHSDIAMISVPDGTIRRVTDRAGNDLVPTFSPSGNQLVFAADAEAAGNWDIWMVDLFEHTLKRLTTDPAFDGGPVVMPKAWLPEGLD